VNAISILHDHYNLADPTSTTAVRSVLADVVAAPSPPRSWTKDQQEEFKTWPIQAQKNIAAREHNREQHLRRKQNELAEAIKAARTAPESSKPVTNERTNQMAKRKVEQDSEPQGGAVPKFDRSKDYSAYEKPTDISKKVDPSWERNDGFAARLDKGKE
jgi:hypothetical protein